MRKQVHKNEKICSSMMPQIDDGRWATEQHSDSISIYVFPEQSNLSSRDVLNESLYKYLEDSFKQPVFYDS